MQSFAGGNYSIREAIQNLYKKYFGTNFRPDFVASSSWNNKLRKEDSVLSGRLYPPQSLFQNELSQKVCISSDESEMDNLNNIQMDFKDSLGRKKN